MGSNGYRGSGISSKRLRMTKRRTLLLSPKKKRGGRETKKAVSLPQQQKQIEKERWRLERDRAQGIAVLEIAVTALQRARQYLDSLQREVDAALISLQPKKPSRRQSSRRKA